MINSVTKYVLRRNVKSVDAIFDLHETKADISNLQIILTLL